MPSVSQRTNYFRCQSFIQKFDDGLAVCTVAFGYGAVLDVFSCAIAQRLDVSEKWFISHGLTPCLMNLGNPDLNRSLDGFPCVIKINLSLTCLAASRRSARLDH